MEPNLNGQMNMEAPAAEAAAGECPTCHLRTLPIYRFCPNCGTKLNSAPLSTTAAAQAWIYFFSAVLPMIAFIFVSKWPGVRYYKSQDPKAKQIGKIAWVILIISSAITIWLAVVWTQSAVQSAMDSVTAGLNY